MGGMALFNAVALMSMNPEATASGSIYDNPDLWRNAGTGIPRT
jgi:hypothetical protein